jgi:HK97 family phage major capsid protein
MVPNIRKLKGTGDANYLWQPGLSQGVPPSLLGRPVMYASDLSSTISSGVDYIIYGDIRAGYQIVDRIGIRVLRDAFTNKPYVGFYTTKRVGGAIKNFEAIKVLRAA